MVSLGCVFTPILAVDLVALDCLDVVCDARSSLDALLLVVFAEGCASVACCSGLTTVVGSAVGAVVGSAVGAAVGS